MKRILFLVIPFLFILPASHAQLDRSKIPTPGPPPKIEVGEYHRHVFDNGLTLLLVENHKIPKVTYNMVFDYDPILQGTVEGYVAMAGRLLGTGSEKRSKDQINEEIDFIGANVSFSHTGLFATCLKKHNEQLLDVLSDALINARFTQEELDKIKKQTLSGLAAEKTDPNAIADRITRKLVYGDSHPYGQKETETSINAIELSHCVSFYQTYIKPNNTYLAMVGDITLSEAIPLINKYFASWKPGEIPRHTYPEPQAPSKNTVALVDRPVSVQSLISVAYPLVFKPGQEGFIQARIMNTILGGGTFRLFNNLRETHGYTYGAYSSLTPDKYIGSFTASAEVRNPVTDSALVQILYEMDRLKKETVPAEELDMVRNYASGTFALALEKPETVASFALNIERYNLPKDYYQNYLKTLAAISPQDINHAALKYLKPGNAYLIVVGKAEEVAKPLESLASGGKIRYFDVEGMEYDPSKKLQPVPAGITAESIIENYLAAIGGRKKLEKLKDYTLSLTTSMQGMSISFKNSRKAPDKLLVEVSAGGMVMSKQVFDGSRGMITSPMGNEEATGEMLEELKSEAIFMPELNYGKHGISLNVNGIEDIKGLPAYKIELLHPGNKKTWLYFDLKTGLKIREITEQGTTDYSDYRDVKGIQFPFLMEAEIQGQALKLQVSEIEINTKLKDDLFKI